MYKNIQSISPIYLSLEYEWKLFGTKIRETSEKKEDMISGETGNCLKKALSKISSIKSKK